MYRYFSLVVLGLVSVAAMPYQMTAEFRAGDELPNCVSKTSQPYCPKTGDNPCLYTYVSCSGGSTHSAINCRTAAGDVSSGCKGNANCTQAHDATYDVTCMGW